MNAQVSFISGTYNLIHIPLHLYSNLLPPILRVLLPPSQRIHTSPDSPEFQLEGLSLDCQHGFLNISVTPIEASVVCHSSWAKHVFEPAVSKLPRDVAKQITISKDTYMVLAVISAGLDAAGRVMELTSPLALAGIPIFFFTTYYSDFILVPTKERHNVIQTLLAKGFVLSEDQSEFVNSSMYSHKRGSSGDGSPPATPPPSTVGELQSRTFELLKKRHVVPFVDDGLELVQCSGREVSHFDNHSYQRPSLSRQVTGNPRRTTWTDTVDTKLYTCIISALISQPRFLSLTLAQDDPPSLLLDRTLLDVFGDSLVGDTDAKLIPIFLNLASLPSEVTGIVCGVAGRLVEKMHLAESSELSYLSTARAGAVVLPEEQATRALATLRPLLSTDAT